MTLKDISYLRLINQQIANTKYNGITELAGWLCAIQAQDYAMAKWAIGLRVKNATDRLIEDAIDNGSILRTHLLRPTWHFVAAEDIHWLVKLTAPGIKASLKSRHRELELSDSDILKTNAIITQAVKGGIHLTRDELMHILKEEGIRTGDNRGSHILFMAELDGLICSGKIKNNKQTYALLNERVPEAQNLSKEEALRKIALKYLRSHGPATVHDLSWWSGLSMADARNAIGMISSDLISEMVDNKIFWFTDHSPLNKEISGQAFLIPAFDEFIISYKDRTAVLSLMDHKKAVSDNGIFRPVIIVNGLVAGLWKRTIKNDKVLIKTNLFHPVNKKVLKSIESKAEAFGIFLERKVDIKHNTI